MSHLEEAQTDFDKKDKRFKVAVGALIAYVVIMLSFLAVQTYITQNTIADNQARNSKASEERFERYTQANEKQHLITQAYIKCIANALLVPVDEREPGAFDQCGIEAKDEVNKTGGSEGTSFLELPKQSKVSPQPAVTTNPANSEPLPENPPSQFPTNSAPPDPDSPLLVLTTPLLPLDLSLGGILKVGN